MAPPRYKSRSHYRTRQSAGERSAIEPSQDFGATALDRPLVDLSALSPRALPPTARPPRALPPTALPPRALPPTALPKTRPARPASVETHPATARPLVPTQTVRLALTVLLTSLLGGVLFGAVLALSRCS